MVSGRAALGKKERGPRFYAVTGTRDVSNHGKHAPQSEYAL